MRVFLLSVLLLFNLQSIAQTISWSAPVSVAASSFENMHPRIVLNAAKEPVIIWGSSSMGGSAMLSHKAGSSFSTPVSLDPAGIPVFVASWVAADIAAKGDTVYAVMKSQPEDTGKMYITRSFDGGHTWSSAMPFATADTGRYPTVTTDAAGNPTVAFMQFSPSSVSAHWVVTRSSDYGSSFGPSVSASNKSGDVCDCCPASVINNGSRVVTLYRNALSNIRTIWARISNDGGNTFGDSLEVDNTNWVVMSCPSSGPDGVMIGDTLYTVFRSSASGTRAYLSKSSLSSPQLVYTKQIAPNFAGLSQQDYPRIANAGNKAAMVWKQTVHTKSKLCFALTDDIRNGFPSAYDTIASSGVANADIAITDNAIHIVWEDLNSGTVMYRKGTYFPVTVQNMAATNRTIEIFPNPANEYFTVSSLVVGDVNTCTLIDNAGKVIALNAVKAGDKLSYELKGLPRGVYAVQLINKEGHSFTAKLVLE